MNIRTISFSTPKFHAKAITNDNQNRFISINKSPKTKTKTLLFATTSENKKTNDLNNILVLSKKKPITEPTAVSDKKGVLLYQKVERDNLFSNGAELINRFHFKI